MALKRTETLIINCYANRRVAVLQLASEPIAAARLVCGIKLAVL